MSSSSLSPRLLFDFGSSLSLDIDIEGLGFFEVFLGFGDEEGFRFKGMNLKLRLERKLLELA